MTRKEWTFEYTAKVLADAAAEKKKVHAIKLKWWEDKKVETMAKVRAEGISVKESVAAHYSNTSGNYGPQIEVDEGMQQDLRECQQKIKEHHGKAVEYDGWVQVLMAFPEARLKVDQDDWLFFFSVTEPADAYLSTVEKAKQ